MQLKSASILMFLVLAVNFQDATIESSDTVMSREFEPVKYICSGPNQQIFLAHVIELKHWHKFYITLSLC